MIKMSLDLVLLLSQNKSLPVVLKLTLPDLFLLELKIRPHRHLKMEVACIRFYGRINQKFIFLGNNFHSCTKKKKKERKILSLKKKTKKNIKIFIYN